MQAPHLQRALRSCGHHHPFASHGEAADDAEIGDRQLVAGVEVDVAGDTLEVELPPFEEDHGVAAGTDLAVEGWPVVELVAGAGLEVPDGQAVETGLDDAGAVRGEQRP